MSDISKSKVSTEIRALLLENPNVTVLVGDRIFPIVAPDGTKGDFIIYQRDEYSQEFSKMGKVSEDCEVLIFAVSENYKRSQDIAAAIKETLEGRYSNPTMEIWMSDSTEVFEDKKYKQVLLFKII